MSEQKTDGRAQENAYQNAIDNVLITPYNNKESMVEGSFLK